MGKNPAMLKLWFCCYIGIQYTSYSEIKLLRSLIQLYFCSNMKKKLHCVQITTYYILFHILQYILNYFILVSHTILELVLTHTKRLISIKFLGWSVTISVANNVFLKGILKIPNPRFGLKPACGGMHYCSVIWLWQQQYALSINCLQKSVI